VQKLSLFALVFSACLPQLTVADDVRISCESAADCPANWRCNQRLLLCLSPTAADPAEPPGPRCGDGIVNEGEACDCGDQTEAVPTTCSGPNSDTAPNRCRTTCVLPGCGDGSVDAAEECDDGNRNAADGCSSTCTRERCGNLTIDPDEACDDGNFVDGDGCSADCRSAETCGNGIRDYLTELCDCGNTGALKPASCPALNGEAGSPCTSQCQTLVCGDGVKTAGEVCDLGLAQNGVAGLPAGYCSRDCQSNGTCGNGYRDSELGEQCDDNNFVSHDGCSSNCTQELGQWELVPSIPSPSPRSGAAQAYDPQREITVLFGGDTTLNADVTWEFNGTRWSQAQPARNPGARRHATMVYDRARTRMVLFGGFGGGAYLNDTWVYNGFEWKQLVTPVRPSAREKHMMVYDVVRDRIVLFGGLTANGLVGDTWELIDSTWSEITPGPLPNPSPRAWGGMAYHEGLGTTMLYGGMTTVPLTASNETWTYNGSDWQLLGTNSVGSIAKQVLVFVNDLSPLGGSLIMHGGQGSETKTYRYDGTTWVTGPTGPTAHSASASWDSSRGKLNEFGGNVDISTISGATKQYDPLTAAWTTLTLAASAPPTRYRSAATYDSARRRVVMFGGNNGGSNNDTWEHDGRNWIAVPTPTTPVGRNLHALSFMPSSARTVMFGGYDGASYRAETCLYDGGDWSCALIAGPSGASGPLGRAIHTMTYDERSASILMFGGEIAPTRLDETWTFDGTHWIEQHPAAKPPARTFAAMAYHEARAQLLMFGGGNASGTISGYDDLWEWTGTNWIARGTSPAALGGRNDVSMGYLPRMQRLVLFGGRVDFGTVTLNDTWELAASGSFTPTRLLGFPPPARMNPATFIDTDTSHVGIIGGYYDTDGNSTLETSNDLWRFSYTSATPDEVCTDGIDNDGDALVDCADPDCTRRNICKPNVCADGSTEQTFAPGLYGCGGSVIFANRRTLCSAIARVCTATEWAALSGTVLPTNNYWTNDALRYKPGACAAGVITGLTTCPSTSFTDPMRVCGAATDAFGNTCGTMGCGLGTPTPNESLGGCVGSIASVTAGTLCCTR
jgi:cysteine-rich repeat protein